MPATRPDGNPRRRSWSRGDLSPLSGPEMSAQQWSDSAGAIAHLRAWAEARTVETIRWYLRDKQPKRWASRLLRAAAVAFAVAGGVLPLISSTTHGLDPNLGYVLLAIAAGCVAYDHFFGLSSGWMRDVATLQALQGRLARFHMDWLMTDVAQLTQAETAQWIVDFSTSVAALRQQANPSVTSPQDLITLRSQGNLSSN